LKAPVRGARGQGQKPRLRSTEIFAGAARACFASRRKRFRFFCGIFAAAALSAGAPRTAAQVSAELEVWPSDAVAPPAVPVALKLTHADGWHTYWENPGTGLPTRIRWTLPAGWSAGEILWPTPDVIRDASGAVTGNGYSGVVRLLVPLTPPDNPPLGTGTFAANANWLMCADVCVPGSARLEIAVEPDAGTRPRFADPAYPLASADWRLFAERRGGRVLLRVEPANPSLPEIAPAGRRFLSGDGAVAFDKPQGWRQSDAGGGEAELEFSENGAFPRELRGVLRNEAGWGASGAKGLRVRVPVVEGAAPAVAGDASATLPAVCLAAFLGGLLLNLMPCVFPVLGLKLLALAKLAGGSRRRAAALGAAHTAGVLLSFWALAGALALARAGGAVLGWGFQLQSPAFVLALAALMLLFAMNLGGVWELRWTPRLPRNADGRSGGLADGLAGGALMVALATPCSAPFLAPALGAAFVLPLAEAFAVFTAMGLGLAAPHAVLSLLPMWTRLLPRPGAWMERLRRALSFLLYGTLVFLVWVLAGQVGRGALAACLLALAALALAVVFLGRRQGNAGVVPALVAPLVLLFAAWFAWPSEGGGADADGLRWEAWSPERVEALRREGRVIYADFTARWCATCQANKRLVFGSAAVRRLVRGQNIALLRADWTNADPRVAEELARHGRRAVPMTLLYKPGRADAVLLPEILTPARVMEALGE
jgi:thiol:disulfide interchange protein DsbD